MFDAGLCLPHLVLNQFRCRDARLSTVVIQTANTFALFIESVEGSGVGRIGREVKLVSARSVRFLKRSFQVLDRAQVNVVSKLLVCSLGRSLIQRLARLLVGGAVFPLAIL